MNKNAPLDEAKSDKRILVWWDIDVCIGAFHKRKLTARPLKFLERALGHRVHVEYRSRFKNMPPDVWKFEAYHYLDTADPALAAYVMLLQISQFSERIGMSWQGFNTAATTASGDPDDATICAFYWPRPHAEATPGRVYSGGALLMLVDVEPTRFHQSHNDHRRQDARPIVQVPPASTALTDYEVAFRVHIFGCDRQDLLGFHWPRFQASRWPNGVGHVDIVPRTQKGKPNIIHVRQTLHQVPEHEAIAYCLSHAQSFQIALDREAGLRLTGERRQSLQGRDGIVSFEMTQI